MVRLLTPISGKKPPPKYENQTIPAQCNSIDKILSERSANEIIVGCRYSLFRKEKPACSQRRTQSSRSSACAWVGTMLLEGHGAGRGFGTGMGCECNSPQHPLCLGAPKGRTERIKPPKPPLKAVNQTKPIPKESVGISAQQELKPKLAGASH